jgi:hypothetical protein
MKRAPWTQCAVSVRRTTGSRPSRAALLLVWCVAGARGACLIGGTVRDADSAKPLARVHVFAKPPAPPEGAPSGPAKPAILRVTDAAGAFCFDSLEPGVYQLVAQRPGYLVAAYGARPGQTDGTPFNIDGHTAQPPVTVPMVAGATLSGVVLDDRGEPVEGAMVDLQRKKWDWIWEPSHVTFAWTGPGGAFRLPAVPPGTYYLRTDPLELPEPGLAFVDLGSGFEALGPLLDEKGRPIVPTSATTFYNGSYSFAHATPIPVKSGQEIDNLVVSMKPRAPRRISGRVAGAFDAKAFAAAAVGATPVVEMVGPAGRPRFGPIHPDGTFTVADLGPLEYDVKVDGLPASITAQVDLSGGDAEGLILEPARAVDLHVNARIEGQEAPPMQPMAICDLEHGCQQRNPPDAQGVYHFNGVRQGIYRFHSRGPGVYVKSVIVDGRPLADSQLDLRRGAPASIAVVLSSQMASLEGRLEASDPQAAALAVSVMLVNEIRYSPAVSNNFVAADHAGRFQFDSVIPGKYRALAIEGFDDGPWGSPELMAALSEKSVVVELGEGEQKKVTLPVVPVGEWEAALRKVGM